jgi:phthiocerol/phenolphthiocerol synthesis type-I polyketide synthase C
VVSTLVVSGKSVARVGSWAAVLADWMQGPGAAVDLAAIAHTLNHHRSRHARFATVCAADHAQAVAGLQAVAAGVPGPGVVLAHEGPCGPGVVFVYSGQGSQWAGMGRQLLADEPAFAAAIAELEPEFLTQTGFSLHDVLADTHPVTGIERIQPVLVGVQLALTALWRSYGMTPDAVIGHSMGEVSAAVVAGILTPAEGLAVITTRSRLLAQLAGHGAMALMELDAQATEALLADHPEVAIAVYASPHQTVIAGPPDHIDGIITAVTADNRLARRIDVDVASHHHTVDPILPQLRAQLTALAPQPAQIPMFSTVDGVHGDPSCDADYWVANLRHPVRFAHAVTAAGIAHTTFIEISPHPLLTYAISDTLADTHHHALATLTRNTHDTISFHTTLNTTHTTHPPHTEHPPGPHPQLPTTPWHHTRHWLTPDTTTPMGTHPLLGAGVTDPTNGIRIWQSNLSPDLLWLGDHRVDNACVLPGAAYAELALAAATETFGDDKPWAIRELCLVQVMPVVDETIVITTLSGDESKPRVEIRTRTGASEWTTHATATLERRSQSPAEPPRLIGAATEFDPAELYRRLRSAGQQHGPAFQGVEGLSVSDRGIARATVRLPSAAKQGARRFLLHPVMVDIALQALGASKAATDLAAQDSGQPTVILPVRLAGIRVYGNVTEGVTAIGSLAATSRPDRFTGHVALTGADGEVLLEIDEIEVALLQGPRAAEELTSCLFALDWESVALGTPTTDVEALLLVSDAATADPLLNTLRIGLAARIAHCEAMSAHDMAGFRDTLGRKDVQWNGIVVVCPPRPVDEALTDTEQLDLALSRTLMVANLVKTLTQIGARNSPRLWIVTRGAQQLGLGDRVTLAQSQLRGFARVLTFEHPELKTTLVDVDADGTESATALIEELLAGRDHDEVALREGQRYVHRLVPARTTSSGELSAEPRYVVVDFAGTRAVRLQIDKPGRLDALTVHAVPRIPPQAGQVEVRVRAAGLNFSDVLKSMGVYPGLDNSAPVLGVECVGIVTAVGAGVHSFEIGQRVAALGPGTFGTHVTTLADLVVAIPDDLPDCQAATVGGAYLTAWHSLCEVGRLAPGERVLIHSATGGVGLAAMSIAKLIGARIYATAGTQTKREMLSGLEVEYVGDSRAVEFADEILAATNGHGVDVILNSLSGEAIGAGLKILAPGGRFIELGKKDVYADASLSLRALAGSASFAVVDLDLNLRLQPQRYGRLLQHIVRHIVDGELQVLPVAEYTLSDAIDAFALMAAGSHTGKIVISIPPDGCIQAIAPAPPQPLVRPDGGYIVAGGMGGLGFVFAKWLVAHGAGLVVLNGRSAPNADVAASIAEMNANGAKVEVVIGDIAEPGTATRLVAAVVDAGLRPAGVLHSATVLADEIVLNMSEPAAVQVFTPKVAGNWWLHQATAELDLDWWLTFSSAASLVGSPGQGAYSAANSWVDGLVAYRRSQGLPAVGINWGPWAEVGRGQSFADLGFTLITAEQGLAAMEMVLRADRARTGMFSLNARQWFQSFQAAAESSLFAGLAESTTIACRDTRIQAELDTLDPGERATKLASMIADEIRAVSHSAQPIDRDHAMESLGLDSLMALELRNRLEDSLGVTLPATIVWSCPTISALASALCERMGYEPCTNGQQTVEVPEPQPALSYKDTDLLAGLVVAAELESTGVAES